MVEADERSGSASPALEEDSLAYCLELQGRPMLQSASLFSLQDGSLSLSRTVSPRIVSEPRVLHSTELQEDLQRGNGVMRSLGTSNGAVGERLWASVAEKYRLSFVDVTENGSSEEETRSAKPHSIQTIGEENIFSERRAGQTPEKCDSVHSLSPGDMQYDDEDSLSPGIGHSHTDRNSVENGISVTRPAARTADVHRKPPALAFIDHTSFSPLYNLSIQQLKKIASVLEEKLQGL